MDSAPEGAIVSFEWFSGAEAAPFRISPPSTHLSKLSRGWSQAQTAVDGQDLAGNKLWRSSEEQYCRRNFFSLAVALHRGLFGHAAHERLGRFLAEIDHAGSDRVDGDLGGESFCHHLGQHVQGGF